MISDFSNFTLFCIYLYLRKNLTGAVEGSEHEGNLCKGTVTKNYLIQNSSISWLV